MHEINRIFVVFFFLVKDRNLFHLVNTIGNIFTRGCATRENITEGCPLDEINFDLSPKKKKPLYLNFHCAGTNLTSFEDSLD